MLLVKSVCCLYGECLHVCLEAQHVRQNSYKAADLEVEQTRKDYVTEGSIHPRGMSSMYSTLPYISNPENDCSFVSWLPS